MVLDRPQTPSPPLPPSKTKPRGSKQTQNAIVDFYLRHWSPILLSIEFLLNLWFLYTGPLHPIDYPTYLVQARQIRLGERDYPKIYGPTGPLVYPGGHVIIFSAFERVFGIKGDSNWGGYLPARCIFLVLQLLQTYVSPPPFCDKSWLDLVGCTSNICSCFAVPSIGLCLLFTHRPCEKCFPKWPFQWLLSKFLFLSWSAVFTASTIRGFINIFLHRSISQDEWVTVGTRGRYLSLGINQDRRNIESVVGGSFSPIPCRNTVSDALMALHSSEFWAR